MCPELGFKRTGTHQKASIAKWQLKVSNMFLCQFKQAKQKLKPSLFITSFEKCTWKGFAQSKMYFPMDLPAHLLGS